MGSGASTGALGLRYGNTPFPFTGAAGLIVSVNRMLTKALVSDMRISIVYLFILSTAIVAACVIAHRIVEGSEFVQYHLSACRSASSLIAFDNDGGASGAGGAGGGVSEEVRVTLVLIRRLTCTWLPAVPSLTTANSSLPKERNSKKTQSSCHNSGSLVVFRRGEIGAQK